MIDAMDSPRDVLLLRLQAPLQSFGGLAVDERRITYEMPGRSMLTGLLANALGWHHRDAEALNRLQERLDMAVRCDCPGSFLQDYQTVDLGQDFLARGWTTRGAPEGRQGGNSSGTHIRTRDYWADAAFTVAVALHGADEAPTLDALEQALRRPARPLFLGRKACLPSRPLVGHRDQTDRVRAASPLQALLHVPPWAAKPVADAFRVWWSAGPTAPDTESPPTIDGVRFIRRLAVLDQRHWHHALHGGQRYLNLGSIPTDALPDPSTFDTGDSPHA